MVTNSIGKPPASRTPCLARLASRSSGMLHGVTSFQLDATPTCALPQSASVMPIARSIARAGRTLHAVGDFVTARLHVGCHRHGRKGSVAAVTDPLAIGLIGAGPWAAHGDRADARGRPADPRDRGLVAHRRRTRRSSARQLHVPGVRRPRRAVRHVRRRRDRGDPGRAARARDPRRARRARRCCSRSRSATTSRSAQAIVDAVGEAGVGTLVMLTNRFDPAARRLPGRGGAHRADRRPGLLHLGRVPRRAVRARLAARARRGARHRPARARPARGRRSARSSPCRPRATRSAGCR